MADSDAPARTNKAALLSMLGCSIGLANESLLRIERHLEEEAPRLHASTYWAIESLLAVYRGWDTGAALLRMQSASNNA